MLKLRTIVFRFLFMSVFGMIAVSAPTYAQQPPQPRKHTVTKAGEVKLRSANVDPITASKINITIENGKRIIRANSISQHKTGAFPGAGNPNQISEQNLRYSLPVKPSMNTSPKHFQLGTFGIGVNGVIFDPQAAEWYLGKRFSKWQYDALGGALPLGFDAHVAHVQPNGSYHYHGMPNGLLKNLSFKQGQHSPLVGWALDGFPIFAVFGQGSDGIIKRLHPSYRLKAGNRPKGQQEPNGKHDGAFVADWEFIEGLGDLDACNGTFTNTKDFPDGTYAYFLTDTFPIVPRCFYGIPVESGPKRSSFGSNSRPNLKNAAKELGVTINDLRAALGPPPPNFHQAARKLGVSEEQLRQALHPR